MKKPRKWVKPAVVALVTVLVCAAYTGYRAYRTVSIGHDMYSQIRYLIENGGTIGEMPVDQALSLGFLSVIFGDNPELLEHLGAIVSKGLADDSALHVGEIAAMLVTHQTDADGSISDVVFYAIGGFPLTRRKPGFHQGGYFFQQLDSHLWNSGNLLIGMVGRDVLLFAANEEVSSRQEALLDALFAGEIMPLVDRLEQPMHFTMVLPEPRHLIPRQLQPHVRAVVVKGYIGHYSGHVEIHVLSPSQRSASYALRILRDLKLMSKLALKTRWHGVERETLWGPVRNPWWAYEMVQTLENSMLSEEGGVVRYVTDFDRVMVNAVLKAIERATRDLAAMRMTLEERMDPRLADARLHSLKPLHYWSEAHQWGPDWPIPPIQTITNVSGDVTLTGEPESETTHL